MTVSVVGSQQTFNEIGPTQFAITQFQFFNEPNDLVVSRNSLGEHQLLTYTSNSPPGPNQYTILNYNTTTKQGTLEIEGPLVTFQSVQVRRQTEQKQDVDFPLSGRFPSESAERANDRQVMMIQEQAAYQYVEPYLPGIVVNYSRTPTSVNREWEGLTLPSGGLFYADVTMAIFTSVTAPNLPTELGIGVSFHAGPLGNLNDPEPGTVPRAALKVPYDPDFHTGSPTPYRETLRIQFPIVGPPVGQTCSFGVFNMFEPGENGAEDRSFRLDTLSLLFIGDMRSRNLLPQ